MNYQESGRNTGKMRYLSNGEKVPFRCRLCGECCRQVKDAVMLEPMDLYNLSRFLRERGAPIDSPDCLMDEYAHSLYIPDGYPFVVLNTMGTNDSCVFLKDGRCSVYAARPRVCRLYPFGVAPGSNGREFCYYLCTEKQHHFGNGAVRTGDWLSDNFPREEREYLKADYQFLAEIGKAVRRMGEIQFRKNLFPFLYYRYFNYELDRPFLPQYFKNTEALRNLFKKIDGGTT